MKASIKTTLAGIAVLATALVGYLDTGVGLDGVYDAAMALAVAVGLISAKDHTSAE